MTAGTSTRFLLRGVIRRPKSNRSYKLKDISADFLLSLNDLPVLADIDKLPSQ